MRCVVYSNRAQCYLKLKKYEQAFMDADKALEYDANHLKSVQRRGTAAYYTKRYRQARRDFMRALKIEHSPHILDYLTKVQEQILKSKAAACEQIKRKALFDSGVNFFDLERTRGDADDAKRLGMAAFKNASERIEVVEMNLDEDQIREMKAKKEKVGKATPIPAEKPVEEGTSKDETTPTDKPAEEKAPEPEQKKKKKKKSKKKGLSAFMENEAEASAFKTIEEETKTKLIEELPPKEDGPTIEELPEEPAVAEEQEPPEESKQSSILLKDDETPPKKNVTFDIEKTTVKEFYKNEKIENVIEEKKKGTPKRKGGKGKNR